MLLLSLQHFLHLAVLINADPHEATASKVALFLLLAVAALVYGVVLVSLWEPMPEEIEVPMEEI
jgi:hypothetical protein